MTRVRLVEPMTGIGVCLPSVDVPAKVRFPPTAADFRTIQDGPQSTHSGHSPVLFDDLVGKAEDRGRDRQPERCRRLEIDH